MKTDIPAIRTKSIILVCLLIAQTAGAESASSWARAIRGVTKTYDPFELELVTEESGRLVATAHYTDYLMSFVDRRPRLPATIKGIRTSDGRFWPEVMAEVSDDIEKNWKQIDTQQRSGDRTKIRFLENSPNEWLHVDLEPFKGMIGKFKYGKVTLTSGERAIFILNNLLPPPVPPGYWCENFLPQIPPFDTLPFVALALLSPTGTDVLAACGYKDDEATSPARLQGTRTQPGITGPSITGEADFWPSVTAQVAVDYNGEWTNIAAPPLPGEPYTMAIEPKAAVTDLYVNLNNFRPYVGKFRYGRVLLRNGKAATFELREVLPVEKYIP